MENKVIISKLILRNALGISELTLRPGQINVFQGKKGTGKTSVLDAIATLFSNKNIRADFVRQGEDDATLYAELSDGSTIDRLKSLKRTDKIDVKKDGVVSSPETFLKSLFFSEQFRPVSFIEATTKEQNKTLLGLVNINWDMTDIERWFGERPAVNYDQHILNILDDIQSKNGKYYLNREETNRDVRNKKAMAKDILGNVPENYDPEYWEITKLSELFGKVTLAEENNRKIQESEGMAERLELEIGALKGKTAEKKLEIQQDLEKQKIRAASAVQSLREQIEELQESQKDIKEKAAQLESYKKDLISDLDVELNEQIHSVQLAAGQSIKEAKSLKPIDIAPLKNAALEAENMKSYLNEYRQAMDLFSTIEGLEAYSASLTEKIEIARSLPTELLKKVDSPVEGLSVSNGVPLINGLPIQNLSTGEQAILAVDIAKQLAGELGVILVDKLECLDSESMEAFISSCKESGLQYFMTRVTDSEFDIIKI